MQLVAGLVSWTSCFSHGTQFLLERTSENKLWVIIFGDLSDPFSKMHEMDLSLPRKEFTVSFDKD